MEIVLFILKTAGVILLVILGIFLLAAALLLFVPVRYRAEGNLPEEGKPQASVRFTWLLHLLSLRVEYEGGLKMTLRLAGARIHPEKWRRRGKEERLQAEVEAEVRDAGNMPEKTEEAAIQKKEEPQNGQERALGQNMSGKKEAQRKEAEKQPEPSQGIPERQEREVSSEAAEKSPGGRIGEWLRSWCEKLRSLTESVRERGRAAEDLLERAGRIRGRLSYYRELLMRDSSQETLRMIWEHLKKLMMHAKPKKLSANLTVGSEDPAVTGKLLAVYGILYPWVGDSLHIFPDFERERLCGDFSAEGRVRACVALYHILRVVLDKKTWTLIRQLKKEELTNG